MCAHVDLPQGEPNINFFPKRHLSYDSPTDSIRCTLRPMSLERNEESKAENVDQDES